MRTPSFLYLFPSFGVKKERFFIFPSWCVSTTTRRQQNYPETSKSAFRGARKSTLSSTVRSGKKSQLRSCENVTILREGANNMWGPQDHCVLTHESDVRTNPHTKRACCTHQQPGRFRTPIELFPHTDIKYLVLGNYCGAYLHPYKPPFFWWEVMTCSQKACRTRYAQDT